MNLPPDTLLPNEPRVADPLQQTLTERFLLPALPALQALLEDLRGRIDPALAARAPVKLGQPYPRGQSQEITQAVHETLGQLDAGTLPARAADGFAALAAFNAHGGSLRHVWGALRGTHFHHAFLFGTLLVDVAADAVGGGKVDIVPFRQARFTPVRDHRHFSLLAESAWHATVYPNHLLPALAPYAPLVMLIPGGSVRIESDAAYMHELALAGGFTSSADVLSGPAMPPDLFGLVADTLGKAGIATAADAVQGQREALRLCARYRDQGRRAGDLGHVRAVELLGKANALLATLQVSQSQRRAA